MAKGTTRHLKYVWIEYGNPRDGVAFTRGLSTLGWENLLAALPVKTDRWGQRREDSAHPLLPVRNRGAALLALPNEKLDHAKVPTYIDDPIFADYRKANGDGKLDQEIAKQNEFICRWVLSPGIKKASSKDVVLTADNDFTDFADIAAISGHGAAGMVWGGGDHARLGDFAKAPPEPTTDRLKYIIIASCFNLSQFNTATWLPVMRRPNPIHGLFGYGAVYPGDDIGRAFFQNFVANLKAKSGAKAKPGTKSLLDAWRDAHFAPFKDRWACMLHADSKDDCMADWLAGKLPTPPQGGEIRWFAESNYPSGQEVKETPPDYTVLFGFGSTVIDHDNSGRKDVGLFPGEGGFLQIACTTGNFFVGEAITVVFYLFRPDHDGMDLPALLTFGTVPEGDLAPKKDLNKSDKTTNVDGFEFTFKKGGINSVRVPYTVNPDCLKAYEQAGDTHGYFNLRITPPGSTPGGTSDIRAYRDGAWLRPKRP
jgi:hypothetical protein